MVYNPPGKIELNGDYPEFGKWVNPSDLDRKHKGITPEQEERGLTKKTGNIILMVSKRLEDLERISNECSPDISSVIPDGKSYSREDVIGLLEDLTITWKTPTIYVGRRGDLRRAEEQKSNFKINLQRMINQVDVYLENRHNFYFEEIGHSFYDDQRLLKYCLAMDPVFCFLDGLEKMIRGWNSRLPSESEYRITGCKIYELQELIENRTMKKETYQKILNGSNPKINRLLKSFEVAIKQKTPTIHIRNNDKYLNGCLEYLKRELKGGRVRNPIEVRPGILYGGDKEVKYQRDMQAMREHYGKKSK
ncbi:hypothetical protein HY638_02960 [Candidatus Woesearchaeota archaeon]|nr:hypothetical protein [Candidatus Woesearchaeota archaeon]